MTITKMFARWLMPMALAIPLSLLFGELSTIFMTGFVLSSLLTVLFDGMENEVYK